MNKFDYKILYKPTGNKIVIVDIPEMSFLTIQGKGHPDQQAFKEASKTLFTISGKLQFKLSSEQKFGYEIMPMEVIWNIDRTHKEFYWKMMIMQPEKSEIIEEELKKLSIQNISLEKYKAGLCLVTLHEGDYPKMNDTLQGIKNFGSLQNLKVENDTHDIYLNDKKTTPIDSLLTTMIVKVVN